MSEQGERPEDQPHVENFDVRVDEKDGKWVVITTADGVETEVESHSDEDAAQRQAKTLADTATRHEGGARQEPVPDSYPE